MGIISGIEQRMAMGTAGLADKWYSPGGSFYGGTGQATKTGVAVSETTALRLAVVWCCIKILAEDSASLPLHLYRRRKGGGKDRAWTDDRYTLLHDQPNPEMSAMTFREAYAAHLVSWGNGYAEIERTKGSIKRPVAIWPITPNRVQVKRNSKKEIIYNISMPNGIQPVTLQKNQVLHTPGLGFDGIIGYSPIAACREAIGLGMALEEFGELYFGNGTHPGVIVSHPSTLSPTAYTNLQNSLTEASSGLGKSHRLLLLEEAMKVEKISVRNDEAQFLESRKFQNIDIGTRIYRIPPHMYGEMDHATFSNIEQQAIDYVTKALRPWLVRLEQAYNAALIDPSERGLYFYEHNVEGLLRGDQASRYTAYSIAKSARILTTNEIREIENRNPIEGGYVLDVTPNMIPPDQVKAKKESKSLSLYRPRLEAAYQRVFTDAAERILRKETKRLRWGIKNHNGNFSAFADEFYKQLPEYIERQILPAFISLSEAVLGMEADINGVNLNGNRPDFDQFVRNQAAKFAQNHVEASKMELSDAIKAGSLEEKISEWESERAAEIAASETVTLAGNIISHLNTITGGTQ
jgi:HK97 family phage portal protein